MRYIELPNEEHDQLTRLADKGTLNPPGPSANSSAMAANVLAHRMKRHLRDAVEVMDTEFVDRLYELFDDLKEFDVDTGERGLFKESLEALQRQLPQALKKEPLVIGSYLLKIMSNPSAAGLIIADVWRYGTEMTIR